MLGQTLIDAGAKLISGDPLADPDADRGREMGSPPLAEHVAKISSPCSCCFRPLLSLRRPQPLELAGRLVVDSEEQPW